MKIKTVMTTLVLLACGTGIVTAADEIAARQKLMKGNGGAIGALAKIAKGENPYDAAVVKTSLETLAANNKDFPNHFPAGTDQGDTAASPAIWKNFDDFKAKSEKLSADAAALLAALPADQAAVGGALKTLGGDCGACHEAYRLKK